MRWLLLLVIPFLSCAILGNSYAVDDVARLREKCAAMQQAIEKGYYDTLVRGKVSDQTRIHKDFAYLLTPTKLQLLERRLSTSTDAAESEALERLKRFLISKNIESKQAGVIDELINCAIRTSVASDQSRIPYTKLQSHLANEKDRDARRKLFLAANRSFEADNVFLGQLVTIEAQDIGSFGYSNYLNFYSEDRRFEPAAVEEAARGFLAASDSLYALLLENVARDRLSLTVEDLRSYDIPRLMRMDAFDIYFPANRLLETVNGAFEAVGIPFTNQTGLTLTLNAGAGADGSFVFPAAVPTDVRISLSGIGGVGDYANLFHSAAIALQYSNTKEKLFEFKTLGPHCISESYGYLFEYILDSRAWLVQTAKVPTDKLREYFESRAFLRLYEARLMCASYLLQIRLTEGPEKARDYYYEVIGPVLGYGLTDRDAERALRYNDFFCVVDRLRGLFLEPCIRTELEKRFGEEWFRNPETGPYLMTQWSVGRRPQLSAVEKEYGADLLNWRPALDEIIELVGVDN